LIGINGVSGGAFLRFNYDNYTNALPVAQQLRLIPRAADFLDYTPGGIDYDSANAVNDIGAADEIHGESGDDTIYGTKGNDVLFGEGQDEDMIGGYGYDWIWGGTGDDGAIGDDGRIYTSRNVQVGVGGADPYSEPLYGVLKVDQVDKAIATPGNIQTAT